VIHFDAKPVSVRTIIGQMKAGIVHMDATKTVQIFSCNLHLNAPRLAVAQIENANLKLNRIHRAVRDGVLMCDAGVIAELQ